uniref:HTH myb-type domain-containing protein n=2 Tax=Aegilops tauschii subsp. strangulata TaxID=200361 RepID=A0A453IKB6_AEGTS
GRNSKSCCLRWCQHLDPRVEAVKPFTIEEDMLIVKYQATYGNR